MHDKIEFDEFYWFAREYPRCYRFHMDAADHRLKSIHSLMNKIHRELSIQIKSEKSQSADLFSVSVSDNRVQQIYWDFESFLSEVNISLDLLSRVVGPAFCDQSPVSFNKMCKLDSPSPIAEAFRKAKKHWVSRVKDYRDCFTHYTPIDTLLHVSMNRGKDGWALRAKLPVNPNIREILGFRYSRRVELLAYAVNVHRRLNAFDRVIARIIDELYRAGEFPKRTNSLFFVGRRHEA